MKNITISILIFLVLIVTSTCIRVGGSSFTTTPQFENRYINTRGSGATVEEVEINQIDSTWPNNEVIFTGQLYNVSYAYGEGDLWSWSVVWNRSYDLWYSSTLAVGDLDPDYPGLEVVDGLYQLFVIHYDNTTQNWTGTMIWDPWSETNGDQYICDVKIGDFDPRHTGNELLCVTGSLVKEFYKDENGTWVKENMSGYLPRIYKCDIGNFDPRFDGNECVIFTENNIAEYAWNGSGWYNEWISWGDVDSGRVAEVVSENNVSEIVCINRGATSTVVIVWWNNTSYERIDAWRYTASGWYTAMAVGDCWSGHEGNEILVGDAETCYLVWEENGEWKGQVIFMAPAYQYITDIEIGEFDTLHPGNEIAVACLDLYELYEAPPVSETSSTFMLFVFPFIAVPAVLIVIRKWRK